MTKQCLNISLIIENINLLISNETVPESDRNIQCGIVNNIPLSEDEKIKNVSKVPYKNNN